MGSVWNIPHISTYGVSFSPLICDYNSLKSFDGGWNELFGGQGLYIILINSGKRERERERERERKGEGGREKWNTKEEFGILEFLK